MADGEELDPQVVGEPLETNVAVVDSTGLLRPRRAGRLRVEASAGGWRMVCG